MDEQNPYAPPRHDFEAPPELPDPTTDTPFLPDGRTVPSGHGNLWIKQGYALFRKNPGVWIGMTVLYVIGTLAIMLPLSMVPYLSNLGGLLFPVLTAGFMVGCDELWHERPLRVGHLFAGFSRNFGSLLLAAAIYVAVAYVAMFVAEAVGGPAYSAFIKGQAKTLKPSDLIGIARATFVDMALLTPVGMAMYFAPSLIAIEGLSAPTAMRMSFIASIRNIPAWIVFSLMTGLWAIAAVIPCGLGVLVLIPVMFASTYVSYRDVFRGAL